MKASEIRKLINIVEAQVEIPSNREEKLALLKDMVENNKKPEVIAAGGSSTSFTMGDLVTLGFAKKEQQRSYGSNFDVWWTYTGPNPVILVSTTGTENGPKKDYQELTNGDETDHVEVDYS